MIDGRETEILLTLDNLIAYHVLTPSTIHKMLGAYILFEFDGIICRRRQASAAYLDMVMEDAKGTGEENVQINLLDYVYKEERGYVLNTLKRYLREKTEEKETLIYRHIIPNGRTLWVKMEIFPVSRGERSSFFCGIFHDISESMQNMHKLEILDRELYYLNHTVPVGYYRCADKSGLPFRYISNSFLNIVGYAREEIEELFDNKFQEMVHPQDRERLFQEGNSTEFFKSKKKIWVEYRMKCRDGYRWMFHQAELFDIEGCRFFQGAIINITDSIVRDTKTIAQGQVLQSMQRKIAEKENEKHTKENSRNYVADTEAKQEMEQNDDRTKNAFLSNISHDIRTPLNAIVGFSEIAENDINNKESVWNCLGKIRAAASHLRNQINNVLEMSQIANGKIELQEGKCSLSLVIRNAISMMQPQFREKQMKLSLDMLELRDNYVYADSVRLQEVFLNILDNMVKFTQEQGMVSICIRQLVSEKKGYGSYEFIFQDTGIGMAKEFLEHIFERFEREKNTTDSGVEGIGLGMAITKALLDKMQGKIYVYSERGKGTKFVIHLLLQLENKMLQKEALPDEGSQEEVRSKEWQYKEAKEKEKLPEQNAKKAFYGKKILLVEDNEMNREIAKELLEDIGFIIETAENGLEAVEMIKESKEGYYDAVLMDIQMPIMNGYQATEAIRRLARKDADKVPIVALTANAFENDRRKAMESGMNAHIPKPLDVRELCGVLAEYLL